MNRISQTGKIDERAVEIIKDARKEYDDNISDADNV